MKEQIDIWDKPATIQRNHFKFKSLSCWSYNIAVGCSHACRFCYVPDVSTIKLGDKLKEYGVADPDTEWGNYLLLRRWDEHAFLQSLRKAESLTDLNPDGNRAVMFCTTTDPYQVIKHPNKDRRKELETHANWLTERALEMILHQSTLNVRILTRGPLAKRHFGLMKEFGNRLLFGMSLPTLDNRLAKVYEPGAPSPSARMTCLKAAKDAGLNVYVAMAPTYPECSKEDIYQTLSAIKDLDPVTVFHEPINIRAENIARIQVNAEKEGVKLLSLVFSSPTAWRNYSLEQLMYVEEAATYLKLPIHLWPDASMGSKAAVEQAEAGGHRTNHQQWLDKWWNRISEWPK